MTGKNRAEDKLELIKLCITRMKETLPKSASEYSKAGYTVKNVIERNLQLISDAQLDLLAYLYKKNFGDAIGKEESLPFKLEGALGKRIIEDFGRRKKLRNGLVHAYTDFALDNEVFEQAKDTRDLEEFSKALKKALGL